ncbi:MAG: hypothetical protein JST89_00070 [Cyanobacteria bacterium SZAS-4]|nr:hypothetical protein [Cyanobacteria bacterium SZAS-4]
MATEALKHFFDTREKVFELTYGLAYHAQKGVDAVGAGRDILTKLFVQDEKDRATATADMEKRLDLAFGGQLPYFYDLVVCRLVDTFEIYVSDLLLLAYKKTPVLLQSPTGDEKQVGYRTILNYIEEGRSISDLHDFMCAKVVHDITFKSWKDRKVKLQGALRKDPFLQEDEFNALRIMAADRNILVHNKGIANAKYLKDVEGISTAALGSQITVTGDRFFEVFEKTKNWSLEVDDNAIKHGAADDTEPDQSGRF